MGTNYYILVKNPTIKVGGNDIWEQFHIGKNSMGWVFTFRWYQYDSIDDNSSYKLYFDNDLHNIIMYNKRENISSQYIIIDEYGKALSLQKLKDIVVSSYNGKRSSSNGNSLYEYDLLNHEFF